MPWVKNVAQRFPIVSFLFIGLDELVSLGFCLDFLLLLYQVGIIIKVKEKYGTFLKRKKESK